MPNHNGNLVEPSDDDREIIQILLDSCKPLRLSLEVVIETIRQKHLFLETELVNLNWILSHLNEAEKELIRLKERVQYE